MNGENNPKIRLLSELGIDTEPAPVIETWEDFRKKNPYSDITGGYTDGVYDMLQRIEKVVKLDDFSQMKEELTKLYNERYDFLKYTIDHP